MARAQTRVRGSSAPLSPSVTEPDRSVPILAAEATCCTVSLSATRLADLSPCAKKGVAVKPREGSALLFYGITLDGNTDPTSLHASCPVIRGEKWTATKWMRGAPGREVDSARR